MLTMTASGSNLTENALKVLRKRYLKRVGNQVVEEPEDMFRRVACAVAKADLNYGKTEQEVKEIKNEFYDYPLDLLWSIRKHPIKFLIYPFYPVFKFFSKEHLTFICKKK